MKIIKNFFSSSSSKFDSVNWNEINSLVQLDSILSESNKEALCLFKHSTRCAISASVLRKLEKKLFVAPKFGTVCYMVKVIENREVSNRISERLNLRHETPQMIILKNETVVAHGSHYDILDMELPL
ncbi:MAG: bacillithiol system redox-active protein YtxJ [Flavobacteriaceae bacterium]|nr:bacillithiol system redox-active protein YtxJ [Flavobacteriaceae bacterium]